jgi:hypothetical protein
MYATSNVQLSPLLQRTPKTGEDDLTPRGVIRSNEINEKSYGEVALDDSKLEAGDTSTLIGGRKFDEDEDDWNDPGQGLGRVTFFCLITVALGLLGLLLFMGKAIDTFDETGNGKGLSKLLANHSQESLLATFPFSPSYYLKDCPSSQPQVGHEHHSTPTPDSSMGLSPTFELIDQPTSSQGTIQNQTAYSETDQDGKPICEKSLTYLLDDDFGVSFFFSNKSTCLNYSYETE